jgi:hypothetical protein
MTRPVDLALYIGGFKSASARFDDSGSDWRLAFTATFETVVWSAAIREHLDAQGAPKFSHLEGAYYVRNLMTHMLPRHGGEAPYHLADAIQSHGTSLANSIALLAVPGDLRDAGFTIGHLHDTWSGLPSGPSMLGRKPSASSLEDVQEWRWQPRSDWPVEPDSNTGKTQYDDYLDGHLVAATFAAIAEYVDSLP